MRLGIFFDRATRKEARVRFPEEQGIWTFDEDDYLLYALLCDPVYCAELLGEDPSNSDYAGMYIVRDYQYPLFRTEGNYVGFACGRNVGKTQSIIWRAVSHAFRRLKEAMLLTAPELIHLLPLTDNVEAAINATRLTREFLDTRNQKTGFTHRPFGVDFADGTKIFGRIPRLTGPQPVDTPVLTPGGWATMGSLAPGDLVTGHDGAATEVLAVTNAWSAPVYRVEFTDRSATLADAHHRWRVRTDMGGWRNVSTAEIGAALDGPPKSHGGRRNMFRVPPQPLVEYHALPAPPLDAYVVGALLGDGSISQKCAYLITADREILEEVVRRLPVGCSVNKVPHKDYAYLLIGPDRHQSNPLLVGLRELGLLGCTAHTKFIPERLKRGSAQERLDVLRGLLDTDGTVKESGAANLIVASRQLAEDAAEIARSLGGWASTAREHQSRGFGVSGTYWRSTIRIKGMTPFLLSRKATRYRIHGRQRHRSICAVTPMGIREVKCIKVAADDEGYLTENLIPTLNTGVKGMHEPDMIVEEAQDYPEAGWTEAHETVMKDHTDADGVPDFTYHFYGVHSGARDSGFFSRTEGGAFMVVNITAMQRYGWSAAEKNAAKAAYGATTSGDYRRNILGEPGGAASPYFSTARLVACLDQDRDSFYNKAEIRVQAGAVHNAAENDQYQVIRAEDFADSGIEIAEALDLPAGYKNVWVGSDIGLTQSPTVIMLFNEERVNKKLRLKLFRRIHLERFSSPDLRKAFYAIARAYGMSLKGVGIDSTGIGLPIRQEMEQDPDAPKHLIDVLTGYMFNAKVPVGVEPEHVTKDEQGRMRDHFGNQVVEEVLPSGERRYVTYMPMVEASTRYLREFVDSTFLLLPFDTKITGDMQGETQQRVRRLAGLKHKPNAFHILDAMRAMAMKYRERDIKEALRVPERQPVLDLAL